MRVSTTIRLTFTVILLIGVYGETGPWTTFAIGLIYLSFEFMTYGMRKVMEIREKYEQSKTVIRNRD